MPEFRFESGRFGPASAALPDRRRQNIVPTSSRYIVEPATASRLASGCLRLRNHMIDMVRDNDQASNLRRVFGRVDHKKIERLGSARVRSIFLVRGPLLQRDFRPRQVDSGSHQEDWQGQHCRSLFAIFRGHGATCGPCRCAAARLLGEPAWGSWVVSKTAVSRGQDRSRFREPFAAEERAAKFLFELLDRAGERRLREHCILRLPREKFRFPRLARKYRTLFISMCGFATSGEKPLALLLGMQARRPSRYRLVDRFCVMRFNIAGAYRTHKPR